MTWTQVGTGKHDNNSEEGWTLLSNGDIVTADVIGEPNSELFNPKSSRMVVGRNLPGESHAGHRDRSADDAAERHGLR